jgi:ligand-binding sensor domain-containing protein
MRRLVWLLFLIYCSSNTYGQLKPIGSWRTHMPYQQCVDVLSAPDRIFGIARNGIFYLQLPDTSIEIITKVDGLSDVTIAKAAYDETLDALLIGYENTKLDLLKKGVITPIDDIFKQEVTGVKSINSIDIIAGIAYVNCGFATVLYDLNREEIKDTYYLGNNGSNLGVTNMALIGNTLYAATDSGVYQADKNNSNLANFQNWSRHGQAFNFPPNKKRVRHMVAFNENLYAYIQDTLYRFDGNTWSIPTEIYQNEIYRLKADGDHLIISHRFAITSYDKTLFKDNLINTPNFEGRSNSACFDQSGTLWIADEFSGILRTENSIVTANYAPNGPYRDMARRLAMENQKMIVASGTVGDNYSVKFTLNGIYQYKNQNWSNFNAKNYPPLSAAYDIITVAIDPKTNKEYYGTFFNGLIEFNNNTFSAEYDFNNSSLGETFGNPGQCRITGLAFDSKGQLWVANYWANKPISVLRTNGTWQAYEFPGVFTELKYVADITIDRFDQKWVVIPGSNAILVFKENSNGTTTFKRLTSGEGAGNLPKDATEVLSITEDLDGRIWVGTNRGLVVFYNASTILNAGASIDGQPIKVIDGEFVQSLLENEAITSIAVDGANRKWMGTRNGAWLFSADGTEQIHYFNEENSPILARRINDIEIDPTNGEVFFATDNGIISYRSDATEGQETNQSTIKVFPSPVPPGYEGPIAVDGLVQNAQVKITDSNGRIVFSAVANGAQAIWYGKNFAGERVQSGVYFVFSTDEEGAERLVSKIAFIR